MSTQIVNFRVFNLTTKKNQRGKLFLILIIDYLQDFYKTFTYLRCTIAFKKKVKIQLVGIHKLESSNPFRYGGVPIALRSNSRNNHFLFQIYPYPWKSDVVIPF